MSHRDTPAAGQPECQLHAAPFVEHGPVIRLDGQLDAEMTQHAVHHRDVVHQGREISAAERLRADWVEFSARYSRSCAAVADRAWLRRSAGMSLGQVIGRCAVKGSKSGSLTSTEISFTSAMFAGSSSSARL